MSKRRCILFVVDRSTRVYLCGGNESDCSRRNRGSMGIGVVLNDYERCDLLINLHEETFKDDIRQIVLPGADKE